MNGAVFYYVFLFSITIIRPFFSLRLSYQCFVFIYSAEKWQHKSYIKVRVNWSSMLIPLFQMEGSLKYNS